MPTEKPMSIRPINSQCSRQQELASGSDVQRVHWNGGPKCDPAQEFDSKGESTLTTRLHDTLSVP